MSPAPPSQKARIDIEKTNDCEERRHLTAHKSIRRVQHLSLRLLLLHTLLIPARIGTFGDLWPPQSPCLDSPDHHLLQPPDLMKKSHLNRHGSAHSSNLDSSPWARD